MVPASTLGSVICGGYDEGIGVVGKLGCLGCIGNNFTLEITDNLLFVFGLCCLHGTSRKHTVNIYLFEFLTERPAWFQRALHL